MMMIDAILKPFTLETVKTNLFNMGVLSLIVEECQGFARQRGHEVRYGGPEYRTDFVPKIRIRVTASDRMLSGVLDQILSSAHTGEIGDGKIFVHRLEAILPIHAEERDEAER